MGEEPLPDRLLLMILGELVRDKGCVEDWPRSTAGTVERRSPFEDYLRLWGESCAELGTPGRLPRRLREVLFPDENPRPSFRPPEPYMRRPQRGEVRQHIAALDDLVPLEHPVRTVWAFAQALDLQDELRPGETKAASPAPCGTRPDGGFMALGDRGRCRQCSAA